MEFSSDDLYTMLMSRTLDPDESPDIKLVCGKILRQFSNIEKSAPHNPESPLFQADLFEELGILMTQLWWLQKALPPE